MLSFKKLTKYGILSTDFCVSERIDFILHFAAVGIFYVGLIMRAWKKYDSYNWNQWFSIIYFRAKFPLTKLMNLLISVFVCGNCTNCTFMCIRPSRKEQEFYEYYINGESLEHPFNKTIIFPTRTFFFSWSIFVWTYLDGSVIK